MTKLKSIEGLWISHTSNDGVELHSASGVLVSQIEDTDDISSLNCEGYTEYAHIPPRGIIPNRLMREDLYLVAQ